jgi:hypothetical protein
MFSFHADNPLLRPASGFPSDANQLDSLDPEKNTPVRRSRFPFVSAASTFLLPLRALFFFSQR